MTEKKHRPDPCLSKASFHSWVIGDSGNRCLCIEKKTKRAEAGGGSEELAVWGVGFAPAVSEHTEIKTFKGI